MQAISSHGRSIKRSPNPIRCIESPDQAPILAHVEAGERSYDFGMPEEINRVTTDILSDLLFTTCEDSDRNLLAEGIDPRKVFCVGNVMVDSLQKFLPKSSKSTILNELNSSSLPKHQNPIKSHDFALVPLHRPINVDDQVVLRMLLSGLIQISETIPIIFPMHPRTRGLMSKLDRKFMQRLSQSRILITKPIGYLDFLSLQTQARLVLTDSGGVQVETSYPGIPCLTLRSRTEWQVTLREGTNLLVSTMRKPLWMPQKVFLRKKNINQLTFNIGMGKLLLE